MVADARKSIDLARAPQPGLVSPYLFLGKKSSSRSKERLDKFVIEEHIGSYDSVTSQISSFT